MNSEIEVKDPPNMTCDVRATRRSIGVGILLVAMSAAHSFAGTDPSSELESTTDLSFELTPASGGVDLVPALSAAAVQDPAEPEEVVAPSGADSWRVGLMPAFWVPVSFDGTMEVGPVGAEIDLDFSDLMDALDFVIEGGLTVTNDDWSILAYGSYFKLGADVKSQTLFGMDEETSLDYELTLVDVAVGKRIARGPLGSGAWRADLLGGLRYWDQKVEIDQTDPVGLAPSIERDVDWVDAFIGGRIVLDISEDVSIWFRGDIGGFSIGSSSDLTWTLATLLEWNLSDNFALVAGYRYVDVDRTTGSGLSRFDFDYSIHGPIIGGLIRF
jgi:opacity protein-like surface antigen